MKKKSKKSPMAEQKAILRDLASEFASASRGVDRVPARYRDDPRPVEFVHQQPKTRTFFKPAGTTYRNPARVARLAKSGRLRKELRS